MSNSTVDYEALAQGVDEVRETVNALVAGFKADGFTDEQARDLVAGLFRSNRGPDDA